MIGILYTSMKNILILTLALTLITQTGLKAQTGVPDTLDNPETKVQK